MGHMTSHNQTPKASPTQAARSSAVGTAHSGACWPAALTSTDDGPSITSPGSRPGRPAYPQPTPVPGSSATRTSAAEPPSGAGPAQSTTMARAPGSPPQASPVTDHPAGMGSGTQAGTRASAVTAEIAS